MSKQRHVIKKQILEIQLSSQQEAFEIQTKISKIYRSKVVPLMDDLFSEFSSPDIIHRIDVWEIDIEDIDINYLEKEFLEKLLQKIKQQLVEKIASSRSSFSTQPQPNLHVMQLRSENDKQINKQRDKLFRDTSLTSPINLPESPNTPPSQTASQQELFSYFIQTGTLPWWAKTLSKQELEEQFEDLINSSSDGVKSILWQSFTDERCLKRLIYQFSEESLRKITQILSPDLSQVIIDYNSDIKIIFQQLEIFKNISQSQFKLEHWRGIFLNLYFASSNNPSNLQFIRDVLLYLATSFTINYQSLLEQIIQLAKRLKKEGFSFKSQILEILSNIYPTDQTKDNKIFKQEMENHINIVENFSQEEAEMRILYSLSNPIEQFGDSEEIYIFNAGLILLWPFLNRFFETIALLQEHNFINSNAAQRAVLLLQFLVDGSTESPEHILPLNKLLCGIDLLEPIEAILDITEQEQEECENLLSAVIHNWSVLKNTSIAGLRSAFLQREGILRMRDRSWLLQVQQETHDVLLDRIPWSIRVIKLPWMDEVLYVEW